MMETRLYFDAKAFSGILSASFFSSATMPASLRFSEERLTILAFITSKSLELMLPVTLRLRILLICRPLADMTASMVPGVLTLTMAYSLAAPSWEYLSFSQSEMPSSAMDISYSPAPRLFTVNVKLCSLPPVYMVSDSFTRS